MKVLSCALLLAIAIMKSSVADKQNCVLDVVFAIDNSGSIGNWGPPGVDNENWQKMKKFINDLVSQLNIGPDATHVGMLDFGTFPHQKFGMNKHMSEADISTAVNAFKYRGESTNTTGALRYAGIQLTDPQYGARGPEVPKVVVLITDGNPTVDKDTWEAAAAKVRGLTVRIVGVGITNQVSESTMLKIVTSPEDYFYTPGFQYLDDIKDRIVSARFCEPVTQPPVPPTTTTPAPVLQCKVDLVFCVDNSDSIDGKQQGGKNWQFIQEFLQNIVSGISVGPDDTHVGLVDFGYKGAIVFDLNKYSDASGVKLGISELLYRGERTNTAGGLAESRKVLTDAQYGARGNVPKVLVVVTDGNPNVDTAKLDGEIQAIKDAKIRTITVAVKDAKAPVDEALMKKMASSDKDALRVENFASLDAIIKTVINEETCKYV
jgi:Mg-chelatase subunit ChlD